MSELWRRTAVLAAVVFTDRDSVEHTVTANSGGFGSPRLAQGRAWKHAFEVPGVHRYYCRIHTYMRGEVVVTN